VSASKTKSISPPFPHFETVSRMTGNKVFFKLENLQMTGSFKERGALNRLLTLTPEEAQRGTSSPT
jgi:threonine dehydratase